MSALTLGKLGALADVSTVLPTLTETELRRLLVLAKAMRRERAGHYRASTLAEEALPAVEVVALALSSLEHLLMASAALYAMREHLADDSVKAARAAEDALDDVLERLLDLDGDNIATLVAALRAASDPPT